MRQISNRIFARTYSADLVGREAELDRLLRHAKGESPPNGLALLAVPSAGTSELLRQTYDRSFVEQEDLIPFYFEVSPRDGTAQNAARRFLFEFLLQTIAFRSRDAKMIDISPTVDEMADLASASDSPWIDRLVEIYHGGSDSNDERSFVRNCLGVPFRAAIHNARSFVIVDGLHATDHLEDGAAFLDDLIGIFSRASIPFVFAGHRRFLFARTKFETMSVEPLSFAGAGELAARLSARTGVASNDQTRDLIAVQTGGKPGSIESLFAAASANGIDLNSFDHVEQVYTDEIFGGRIGKHFETIFDLILPDSADQKTVIRLISEQLASHADNVPVTHWQRHTGLTHAAFRAALGALNRNEIINISSGSIKVEASNLVLSDHINGRAQLETGGKARALVVGEALTENVRRAPELMARFYRKNTAIGLRELVRTFDGRKVSPALLDYGKFKDEFKGATDKKILKSLREGNEKISLPQIVYTAHTGDLYPKLNEVCDVERSAVAFGFAGGGEKQETVWIAAEVDSKLEASREVAEFWCDRLEMAALNCNFTTFHLWLIAPEGFTSDAMDLLRARNAHGSSRKQVELLAGIMGTDINHSAEKSANEYEFVFPMGENTEMIAAYTVEEIAKRHAFPTKAINQIKTALVEACINAAEHSLSPDGKIYQKFAIDHDKITITISNRGLRLADKIMKETAPDEGRRGWGLKLITGLMDEVTVERVDDGTRVTMVKYRQQA
jgi:serine/threonine-protein kinase RsbW